MNTSTYSSVNPKIMDLANLVDTVDKISEAQYKLTNK